MEEMIGEAERQKMEEQAALADMSKAYEDLNSAMRKLVSFGYQFRMDEEGDGKKFFKIMATKSVVITFI